MYPKCILICHSKDTSKPKSFYLHILNITVSCLQELSPCVHKDISFLKCIIDEKYAKQCRSKMNNSFTDDELVDGIQQMLYFNGHMMINILLVPF
jgi:hypothetical protein